MDPHNVMHEIKTYPGAKLMRKKVLMVHPWKCKSIKVEVKKILHVGFTYPMPLTEWVSNIVHITNK